ncbi:MAG: hypothetical protein K8U57_24780 [Planctomycetes bacterium]|nr:hypothetical protein [Planctomycetota bacterium]
MANKSRSKADLKQMLVAKGEFLAMGIAGLFLLIFLIWGASRWSGAKNPVEMAEKLDRQAAAVHAKIANPQVSDEEFNRDAKLPDWLTKPFKTPTVSINWFDVTGPQFDPIAKPDTKRENPTVLTIGEYQVDLVRAPMKGYDITFDNAGNARIGVIISKAVSEQDKEKRKTLGQTIVRRGNRGFHNPMGPMPMPMGPMGMGQPPMGMGQPPVGPGGKMISGINPYGNLGGSFEANGQRMEKALKYVPLEELDKALEAGEVPAMTVIPLRMVIINAEIPYKKQVDEIKRALRLPTSAEAQKWGPLYDGYEVQRRVSRILPGGNVDVFQDWSDYKFEDKYSELINARKLADHFEDGYLSHFIRYDMALALPLPQLVDELGKYPNIRLKEINETIVKLKNANRKPETPSDLLNRLGGRPARNDLYHPQTGEATGAAGIFGQDQVGGPVLPVGKGANPPKGPLGLPAPMGAPGGPPKPGDISNQNAAPPVEIEQLLLRFVDVDVKPGYTYEYKVRLRMINPNLGMTKEVAIPAYANVKEIYSPWAQIKDSITVPTESFLFSIDPSTFRKKIEEEYSKEKELRERLQAKDNQVVVEMCSWLEQVRTDAGGNREPVGAWVVADMPVGRGEYVGRKQYIKLPLWSSKDNQYVLREVADKTIVGKKDIALPRGWLVDFTTKSVLVDFEGGKVITKNANGKIATEEVATEMLIVRPDGKLLVKSSLVDEADENRRKIVGDWDKWILAVSQRKSTADNTGKNPFEK